MHIQLASAESQQNLAFIHY